MKAWQVASLAKKEGEKMTTSKDIETEIENLLIGKLDSETMSEFRRLLEKFELEVFDEGKERGMDEEAREPREPPSRDEDG
ncbi:MAG: hypothetical protein Sv326_1331 (plasmid) [Candidatus Fermentimicrarchaeum limneticum]|uniref:Uncharacterized protein n=1 Tax=Fermentimicrarchaeum limneticum TaxID=2795018 RepID=A0A7D5XMD7_FERL1|nr:MAG: hypothetical protein Sv326_1331 [Candidatus Fermentimicrarchaeum limneticum]